MSLGFNQRREGMRLASTAVETQEQTLTRGELEVQLERVKEELEHVNAEYNKLVSELPRNFFRYLFSDKAKEKEVDARLEQLRDKMWDLLKNWARLQARKSD